MTGPEPSDAQIRSFRIEVAETDIEDLRGRLAPPAGLTSCQASGGAGACRSGT